jgi:hypothetical protein
MVHYFDCPLMLYMQLPLPYVSAVSHDALMPVCMEMFDSEGRWGKWYVKLNSPGE